MNKNISKSYPSKILLFGEYSVIDNSDALAISFNDFKGLWDFQKNINNDYFLPYLNYLSKIEWASLHVKFNYVKLKKDIFNGLFFQSNIPEGYGAGSSGALSAAVYDIYFEEKPGNILITKNILAKIEAFFHGISSGIDPLVSYLNKGILMKNKSDFEILENVNLNLQNYDLYLLDSKIKRETKSFVNIYKNKIKTTEFVKQKLNYMIEINNNIIKCFLKKDENNFYDFYKKISAFQFNYFKPMITKEIYALWENSLSSNDYAFKLCGAGGGGFYLILNKKGNNLNVNDYKTIKI